MIYVNTLKINGYLKIKTYLIGYDLNKRGQDYTSLIDAIKELTDTWWHHLDSTWIVKCNRSASDIRNTLKSYIDDNDELLVVRLSGEGAWSGFDERGSKWLRDHLSYE